MSLLSETPITLEEMIREVRRECELRRNVYHRRVMERRMNQRMADYRIEVMDAVLARLERDRDAGRTQ